jgi:hypothetical protein
MEGEAEARRGRPGQLVIPEIRARLCERGTPPMPTYMLPSCISSRSTTQSVMRGLEYRKVRGNLKVVSQILVRRNRVETRRNFH